MATQNRQNAVHSSASSTSAAGMRMGIPPVQQTIKRAPLANLTNRSGVPRVSGWKANQELLGSTTTGEKGLATQETVAGIRRKSLPAPSTQKLSVVIPQDEELRPKQNIQLSVIDPKLGSRRMDTSPMRRMSDECSVSLDESMSTCESTKSPDFEYIDTADLSSMASLERRTSQHLCISDETRAQIVPVNFEQTSRLSPAPGSKRTKVVSGDDDNKDPLCAEYAFDIYDHLRIAEVAEEYRLVPDTLYLTVNYIDRYLSDLFDATLLEVSSYLAELSLREYNLLCYIPSLIAASAIFLAKFMLSPSKMPWTLHLRHYTRYQPSELYKCVKALHSLRINNQGINLPAIREKYGQHKYKCVANVDCPATIPPEFFRDLKDY